jgi:RHS repeat-associated protein
MAMTPSVQGIANSNVLRLDFAYDYMGRRIQKIVSVWNGTGFTPQSTSLFVYDGWNLLAVVNAQATIQQSYMWGNDLSCKFEGFGGVGGLLMASITNTNCFATYDGNGNVTALINAADNSLSARYEYSAFGQLLRATGSLAFKNQFRFSTKFADDESGLIYYGYRYFNPSSGKWISRDPLEEKGGINLLVFCLNHPINRIDTDGRDGDEISLMSSMGTAAAISGFSGAAISGSIGIFKKEFLNSGTWAGIGKEALEGGFLGALMGPIGEFADALQAEAGLGEGMVGTEFATGLSWGIQGMMATAGGAGLNSTVFGDNEDVNDLMKNPSEQLGIGFAVGMIAGLIKSGVVENGGIDSYDPDGSERILDISLDFANEAGVDAAESIWSTATTVSDQF